MRARPATGTSPRTAAVRALLVLECHVRLRDIELRLDLSERPFQRAA